MKTDCKPYYNNELHVTLRIPAAFPSSHDTNKCKLHEWVSFEVEKSKKNTMKIKIKPKMNVMLNYVIVKNLAFEGFSHG